MFHDLFRHAQVRWADISQVDVIKSEQSSRDDKDNFDYYGCDNTHGAK